MLVRLLMRSNATTNSLRSENKQLDIAKRQADGELEATIKALKKQGLRLTETNKNYHQLASVSNNLEVSILLADVDGNFFWSNVGFTNLYKCSFTEFCNNIADNITAYGQKFDMSDYLDKMLNQHRAISFTSKITMPIGDDKWFRTILQPITNTYNNSIIYAIVQEDVSVLKMINHKLQRLSMVAAKSNNSMLIFSANGTLEWVNDAFHHIHGFTQSEFMKQVGDNLTDYLKWSHSEIIDYKSTPAISFIGPFYTKDNNIKWKKTTISEIKDKNNNVANYVAIETDVTELKQVEQQLISEKQKSEDLLLNILPKETADELKNRGYATPRTYKYVSVMFADIKNFTQWARKVEPRDLINTLQMLFTEFDDIISRNYLEKIKTIGDAYFCAGGLPIHNKSNPFNIIIAAFEIQKIMHQVEQEISKGTGMPWKMRIGIHTGPVIAGVVGKLRTTYDIWGDTVNTANRLETACEPDKINISKATYDIVKEYFECEYRGKIEVKHMGEIDMYFVNRIKPEYSADEEGTTPNAEFKKMLVTL